MKKTFNFIYLTQNLINGKIYIGVHSTNNMNDGYIGSGKKLSDAIIQHGKENFKRHIICHARNKEEAYEIESWIVDRNFLEREDVYNIIPGGHGGNTYQKLPEERKQEIKNISSKTHKGKKVSDETKRKQKETLAKTPKEIKKLRAAKTKKTIYETYEVHPGIVAAANAKRGKTLDEMYGSEKAAQITSKLKKTVSQWSDEYKSQVNHAKGASLRGKTYEEKYGPEKAAELKRKRSETMKAKRQ